MYFYLAGAFLAPRISALAGSALAGVTRGADKERSKVSLTS